MTQFDNEQYKEVRCPSCQELYLVKEGKKIKIECSRCGTYFEKIDRGIWKIIKGS